MTPPPRIILPDNGKNLLRRELAAAFTALGCVVTRVHPAHLADPAHAESLSRVAALGPSLLLSINFQGLERPRPVLEALESSGSRAAVWCVDNPWNLLAGVRDPSWKSIPLFVVDKSFVGPLRQAGAEHVYHLPLAACPELFAFKGEVPKAVSIRPGSACKTPGGEHIASESSDLAPLIFVGRLAFPDKDRFFTGIELPDDLLQAARAELQAGLRPDFDWWTSRLMADPAQFWPGKKARVPALGAETCNQHLRESCFSAAAQVGAELAVGGPGLDLFGDAPWVLPSGVRTNAPVDYYTHLSGIYHKARYSLCCTSLLLPHGLNQRHFDIWTAGGVCLTDNTPGLDLFPVELTRPVTFSRPEAIPTVVRELEAMPAAGRAALIRDWQALLQQSHTYTHRAAYLLEHCRG